MHKYSDFAEYYDYDHNISFDIDFYRQYAAESGSPILELACGTGRLVIPLAQAGFEIYGVDISANMLAVCRSQVERYRLEDRVHLFQADMSDFILPRRDFCLAFVALRSFMHLLGQAEQLNCLKNAYAHLRPGGCFIVAVIAPDLEQLAQSPIEKFTLRREMDLPNGNHVLRRDRLVSHDRVHQIRQFELKFEEYNSSGELVREQIIPMQLRYLFRYELELLLKAAGFELIEIFRDYEKNPYTGTGEMIAIARSPQ